MTTDLAQLKDWRFSIDNEDIAWAVFDKEGTSTNTLGRRPLEELGLIIARAEELARTKAAQGLIFLSGKEKNFIVGADINEFEGFGSESQVIDSIRQVNDQLDRLEKLPIPVVCAIHGLCLGGGLELALACHWRIADREEGTRVGFPEVKLGIFPGFNGTARSIRQAGAMNAMTAMLQGSMLRANVARAQGLVDELVDTHHKLRWSARRAVLQKRKSKPAGFLKDRLRQWPIRGYLADQMRAKTKAKVREEHYPAPFRLIDLFDRYGGDFRAMKSAETRLFAPLMVGNTSRALRRVFKLMEMLKAQAPKSSAFKPLRAHIIGAGTMGADIASVCVASGMEVSLQDLSEDQLRKALDGAKSYFRRRLKSKTAVDAAMARLIADPKGEHVPRADVVIEAIVEKLDVKQKLFADLETRMKPGAVMATNTSSLPIEDIAAPLKDPGRLIGIHFFNPVPQMPLVEIVRGPGSRQDEVDKGCAFVTAIDKFPLVVKSVPGFLVNRVLAPYMTGAMQKVEEGIAKEKIDEAAKAFGMPMGPIELADTVGLDVCLHVGEILNPGSNAAKASKLAEMVAAGKKGKKSGEGFYKWKDGKPERQERTYNKSELDELGRELVEPLIRECQKAVEEGVVSSADLADAGMIFGTGFAPFRGGPLYFKAHEARPATLASVPGRQAAE